MFLKDLKGCSPSDLHPLLYKITNPCGQFLHVNFNTEFTDKAEQPVSGDMRNKVAELDPVGLLRRLCVELVGVENVKTRFLEFDNHSDKDIFSMGHASEVLHSLRITIRKISIDCGGCLNLLADCERIVGAGYTMNMNADEASMQCATLAVVIGILEHPPSNGPPVPGASLQGLKYFLKEFGQKMPEEDFRKLTTMAMRTSY